MMVAPDSSPRIRRILVALDTSVDAEAALEASVRLAALLEAELVGLHVEDVNLVRLAQHPESYEVEYFSARRRLLPGPELERQLRLQVARLRRRLTRIAGRLGVRSSFRTARGRVAAELLANLEEADLVVVGARGRLRGRGPGSTVQALMVEGGGPTLVLRRGMRLDRGIYLLHDGSDAAAEALRIVAQLLRTTEMDLTVLIAGSGEQREQVEHEVQQQLADRDLHARLVSLSPDWRELEHLAAVLRQEEAGLFVAPRSTVQGGRRELSRFLTRLHCPLLLVAAKPHR